jgi:hypothetical protein
VVGAPPPRAFVPIDSLDDRVSCRRWGSGSPLVLCRHDGMGQLHRVCLGSRYRRTKAQRSCERILRTGGCELQEQLQRCRRRTHFGWQAHGEEGGGGNTSTGRRGRRQRRHDEATRPADGERGMEAMADASRQ